MTYRTYSFMRLASTILAAAHAVSVFAQNNAREPRETMPPPFAELFQRRVADLSKPDWLNDITRENWPAMQSKMRRELQSMAAAKPAFDSIVSNYRSK